jgi:hypothetical protein
LTLAALLLPGVLLTRSLAAFLVLLAGPLAAPLLLSRHLIWIVLLLLLLLGLLLLVPVLVLLRHEMLLRLSFAPLA